MRFLTHLLPSYVLAAVLAVIFGTAGLAQQRFASPEDGAKALVEAAQHPGEGRLDVIFGPGAKELLVSGDDAVDRERIEQFLRLARESNTVVDAGNGYKALVFGAAGWRFPVPLRSRDGQWIFDLSAGRQAIIDRRIGRNELAAIGACADYVDAQKEYYSSLHDDEPVQQFARRFISSQGRHDGLWWEPANQADRSPLGDRIAAAAAEKTGEGGKPTPYHGYIYRILAGQGPAAPGGAYSYIVGGRMLGGFALLAFPERWGETGLMTFLCGQQGDVYQQNLGPRTGAIAAKIDRFDPSRGWADVAGN